MTFAFNYHNITLRVWMFLELVIMLEKLPYQNCDWSFETSNVSSGHSTHHQGHENIFMSPVMGGVSSGNVGRFKTPLTVLIQKLL